MPKLPRNRPSVRGLAGLVGVVAFVLTVVFSIANSIAVEAL